MLVNIADASVLLKQNKVVAFPTETVYGLGGNALSDDAVQSIFTIKGRPANNPLIIHFNSVAQALNYCELDPRALKLISILWPGPLTIVAIKKKEAKISSFASAGLDTIAVRYPDHAIAQKLLSGLNFPLAAPSANISGSISPTSAVHVSDSFGGSVPVIDGGKANIGLESTIIDLTSQSPVILRYGFITPEVIVKIINQEVNTENNISILKAPGMMDKHYAPSCNLRVNASKAFSDEVVLNFGRSNLEGAFSYNLSPTSNINEAATNLFAFMRQAEKVVLWNKLKGIVIAPIPNIGIGLAINDRISRAAFN